VTAAVGAEVAVAAVREVAVAEGCAGSGKTVGAGGLAAGAEVTVAAVVQAARKKQAAREILVNLVKFLWASIIHTLSYMILIGSYH
jgi:hypothetical protein